MLLHFGILLTLIANGWSDTSSPVVISTDYYHNQDNITKAVYLYQRAKDSSLTRLTFETYRDGETSVTRAEIPADHCTKVNLWQKDLTPGTYGTFCAHKTHAKSFCGLQRIRVHLRLWLRKNSLCFRNGPEGSPHRSRHLPRNNFQHNVLWWVLASCVYQFPAYCNFGGEIGLSFTKTTLYAMVECKTPTFSLMACTLELREVNSTLFFVGATERNWFNDSPQVASKRVTSIAKPSFSADDEGSRYKKFKLNLLRYNFFYKCLLHVCDQPKWRRIYCSKNRIFFKQWK